MRIAMKRGKFHYQETLDERPEGPVGDLLKNFHHAARVRLHAFQRTAADLPRAFASDSLPNESGCHWVPCLGQTRSCTGVSHFSMTAANGYKWIELIAAWNVEGVLCAAHKGLPTFHL